MLRIFHRIRAFLGGYFWLPCPICGKYFGGHEKHGTLWISSFHGRLTCIKCEDKAKERSKEYAIPTEGDVKIFVDLK